METAPTSPLHYFVVFELSLSELWFRGWRHHRRRRHLCRNHLTWLAISTADEWCPLTCSFSKRNWLSCSRRTRSSRRCRTNSDRTCCCCILPSLRFLFATINHKSIRHLERNRTCNNINRQKHWKPLICRESEFKVLLPLSLLGVDLWLPAWNVAILIVPLLQKNWEANKTLTALKPSWMGNLLLLVL